MTEFKYPPFARKATESSSLHLPKSIAILRAIDKHDYCTLIETGNFGSREYIVLDVGVQIPQHPVNDIRETERILIDIQEAGENIPIVYALRIDFPEDIPHLNAPLFETPKCLCLYEQAPEEININWSGLSFLQRIREWLSFTAKNNLHQGTQQLEPYFLNPVGHIILPYPIVPGTPLKILRGSYLDDYNVNFYAYHSDESNNSQTDSDFHILTLTAKEITHGVIRRTPGCLRDLFEILIDLEIDLIEELNTLLTHNQLYKKRILLLLLIPTKRESDHQYESILKYGFLIHDTLEGLSKKIGLLIQLPDSKSFIPALTTYITDVDKTDFKTKVIQVGADIPVSYVQPHNNYHIDLARALSGVTETSRVITQIGLGAIGSSIFSILSRCGFGKSYNLIDYDTFLPHNLSRHILDSNALSIFKSEAIAIQANGLFNSKEFCKFIVDKVSAKSKTSTKDILLSSDIIIDTSASVAVSRFLSRLDLQKGFVITAFLNPQGTDLIILKEDNNRVLMLTLLEMQYYSALINRTSLSSHLNVPDNGIRYSAGCRDVTLTMPNENIPILSGVAAKFIKIETSNSYASINIWSIKEDYKLEHTPIELIEFETIDLQGWSLFLSKNVISILSEHRKLRLPNETGGILIGGIDMAAKEIYVTDTIISPKDSKEYPISYTRGVEGVMSEIERIQKQTLNNFGYLGEWHSHPTGYSLQPSQDDQNLMNWISQNFNIDGKPKLMLIIGETSFGAFLIE